LPEKSNEPKEDANMGLKKETQAEQKANLERKLENRLKLLSGRGIEAPDINKDVLVKRLRANIKAVNARLIAIADIEKKNEELAKIKAEKAALPAKEKESAKAKKAEEAPEGGKEKKKKKKQE
jgi:hypothetical protein